MGEFLNQSHKVRMVTLKIFLINNDTDFKFLVMNMNNINAPQSKLQLITYGKLKSKEIIQTPMSRSLRCKIPLKTNYANRKFRITKKSWTSQDDTKQIQDRPRNHGKNDIDFMTYFHLMFKNESQRMQFSYACVI